MTLTQQRILWILYWVGLFAIMHIPKPPGLSLHFRYADKVLHFGAYAVLAGLCAAYARRSGRALTGGWYMKWVLLLAVYAAVDEGLQPLVHRTADVFDWAADMGGVLAVFIIIRFRWGHEKSV